MDTKNLVPFTVLIVVSALLIGVGILTFDKFGDQTRIDTAITNESVTFAYAGSNLFTGTLTNNDIRSLGVVYNVSNASVVQASNITYLTTGVVSISNASIKRYPGIYYTSYVYGAESRTSTALTAQANAVGDISNSWMSLIITIVVLAIILSLVIRSFVMGNR